jgi:hypothetical protein
VPHPMPFLYEFKVIPQCVECHRAVVELERGWRAYLVPADEGPEAELVVICPDCAEREQLA